MTKMSLATLFALMVLTRMHAVRDSAEKGSGALVATRVRAVRDAPALQDESSAGDECDLNIEVSDAIEKGRHDYYCIWASKAHRWLGTAIKRMRAGRKDLVQWFILKDQPEAEREHVEDGVRERLIKMQAGLENLYIEKGSECEVRRENGRREGSHGTLAYVYPHEKRGNAFIVYVCEYAKEFNGDMSTQTLVHEISHHMGTDDMIERKSGNKAYGKKICLALTAQQAINNADTYAHYVHALAKRSGSKSTLYEEGSGTPHAYCNTGCDPVEWDYGEPQTGKLSETKDLELVPPLGQCLDCSWLRKDSTLGSLAGWWTSNDTASGECGGGGEEWVTIETDDCDAIGCEYITSDSECRKAAAAFDIDFELQRSRSKAWKKDKPFGCHVSDEGLFMNVNQLSEELASPSDKMICTCPSSQEYASATGYSACCTAYECERPK